MNSATQTNRPNVPIPAPIFMGLFLLLGYSLNQTWSMTLDAGLAQFYAGWMYIFGATILLLWCFGLFIHNRTTIMPRNPVNRLVIQGPYRFSRNPMYLSLALFHLGIGIATGNIWHIVTFAPSMLTIRFFVIAPEEHYMRATFGSEYERYCAKVPRWF